MICKNFSRFFVMLAVPVITLFACFVAFSIDVGALTVSSSLTPNEFYNLIGDSLSYTYFDGTSYVDRVAYFDHTGTISTLNSSGNYVYGVPCLIFIDDVIDSVNTNINYDTVTIHPAFYFQNISSLSMSFYCSTGTGTAYNGQVSTVYRSPSVDFYVDGSRIHQNYTWRSGSGYTNFVSSDNDLYYNQAALNWSSEDQAALITLGDVHFNGVDDYYDRIQFAITVPTVSANSDIIAGQYVDPNSGSGGQTIINNNVDLTETHGFLNDIWEAITGIPSSILSGIQSIFVPSDEFMEDFGDELDAIKARFEWSEEIKDIGADFKDILQNQENASAPVVVLPSITNSKDGTVYTSGGENVLDLGEFETEVIIVRGILAVLLWVFFLWRLYARLPDIIHGSGMIVGDGTRIMNELDERKSQEFYNDLDNHHIDNLT